MSSWIYVFSKFTPEALLFEALIIFTLSVGYTAFWVLQKRRLGVIHTPELPSGVVKGYLSQLILDAEQLRAQLFGLLSAAGVQLAPSHAQLQMHAQPAAAPAAGAPSLAGDPEAQQRLIALEGKMAEQAKAMETILAEKIRMEKELNEARSKTGGGGSSPEVPKLQEKIQTLESKLAEYSVIEDDLANLKRLQQENSQLKAALGKAGGAVATSPSAAAPATAKAAPLAAAAVEPTVLAAAAAETPPADANFEGLVDQVEASLQNADAPSPSGASDDPLAGLETLAENSPQAAAGSPLDGLNTSSGGAAADAAPPLETPPPSAAGAGQKSDEDLVAEFEKMLNS